MKACFLLLFFIPVLFSCNKPGNSRIDKRIDAETPFVIAYHQQLIVQTGNSSPFSVKFDEKYDSRCPKGFECVWAGTTKIDLSVNRQPYHLEINIPSHFSANGRDYTITLVQLDPYPDHGYPDATSYKATLLIQ